MGSGGALAYIINLEPSGFIAVSSDTDFVPVIAYSFKSNFYSDNEPRNILYNMMKKDLESRRQALGMINVQKTMTYGISISVRIELILHRADSKNGLTDLPPERMAG